MADWKTIGAVALTLALFVFILGDNTALRDFLGSVGEKLGGLTLPAQAQPNRTVAFNAVLQQTEPDKISIRSAASYVAADKLRFNDFNGLVVVTLSSSSVELDGRYNMLQYDASNITAGATTVKTSLLAPNLDVVGATPGGLQFSRASGTVTAAGTATTLDGYGLRIDDFYGNISYAKPNLIIKGVAKSVRIDTGRQIVTIS